MEKGAKILLVLTLLVFIGLSVFTIFVTDRESWFDVSFSLETVHTLRTEGFSSIDFQQHDVHPPAYYYALTLWSYANPTYLSSPSTGISEYHWAQLFGVLCGIAFFIFISLGFFIKLIIFSVSGLNPMSLAGFPTAI